MNRVMFNQFLSQIKEYQSFKNEIAQYSYDIGFELQSNIRRIDALVFQFNELFSFCELHNIDMQSLDIQDGDLLDILSDKIAHFNSKMRIHSLNYSYERNSKWKDLINKNYRKVSNICNPIIATVFPCFYFTGLCNHFYKDTDRYSFSFAGLLFSLLITLVSYSLLGVLIHYKYDLWSQSFILYSFYIYQILVIPIFIFWSIDILKSPKSIDMLLRKRLFKDLSWFAKIKYLFKFSITGIFEKEKEKKFFQEYLSNDIIRLAENNLLDEIYYQNVMEQIKPYMVVSHINSHQEADKLLEEVNRIKKRQADELHDLMKKKNINYISFISIYRYE